MKKLTLASLDEKDLVRRYLIWCYKTTKENFDRIERKFTQVKVDEFIFNRLTSSKRFLFFQENTLYQKQLDEFRLYIDQKRNDGEKLKFFQKRYTANYQFTKNRLEAVEEAISYFLGKSELARIKKLYEEEFTKRILEAREH